MYRVRSIVKHSTLAKVTFRLIVLIRMDIKSVRALLIVTVIYQSPLVRVVVSRISIGLINHLLLVKGLTLIALHNPLHLIVSFVNCLRRNLVMISPCVSTLILLGLGTIETIAFCYVFLSQAF